MSKENDYFIVKILLILLFLTVVPTLFLLNSNDNSENNFKSSELNFVRFEKNYFFQSKPAKAVFESKEQKEYFTVELTQYEFEHFPLDEGETIKTIDNEDYILIFDKKKELNTY